MKPKAPEKFQQALDLCKSLTEVKYQPTDITFTAIELLCEVAQNPLDLRKLCQQNASQIQEICQVIDEYATSVDNWRVDCPLGFGVKDHCTFLSFLLNLHNYKFRYFTGNFSQPEQIAELFQDWQRIDLSSVIQDSVIFLH